MTVTVPALQAFEYEGRSFQQGEPVTVAPVVAAALSRLGYVTLVAGATMAESPRKRRRTYRRRDLRAES
jgi:hypothetical protein